MLLLPSQPSLRQATTRHQLDRKEVLRALVPRRGCSHAAGLWELGCRSSLWGSSQAGPPHWLGSPTRLHPAVLAGVPMEHKTWAKPRQHTVTCGALSHGCSTAWKPPGTPTALCYRPISLLIEILGPGPPHSTATPVGAPPGAASQVNTELELNSKTAGPLPPPCPRRHPSGLGRFNPK